MFKSIAYKWKMKKQIEENLIWIVNNSCYLFWVTFLGTPVQILNLHLHKFGKQNF